jgi:hypothetical protein
MKAVTKCSVEGCTEKPVESLILRDQVGHVHDCSAHAAEVREWCDVVGSLYITQFGCQIIPCTGDVHIYIAEPTPL